MDLTSETGAALLEGFGEADDPETLARALEARIRVLGFESCTYALLRAPGGAKALRYLTNYPQAWVERYLQQDYQNRDPIIQALPQQVVSYRWDRLTRGWPLGAGQRRVLDEARDFRIRNGVTVPLHGPGEVLAQLSVTSGREGAAFEELWSRQRAGLLVLAYHLHDVILKACADSAHARPGPLGPRERECLLWAARGKTVWESARILGISEATAQAYIRNAQRKLGVHGKTHAVVRAVQLGYIHP